MVLRIEWISSGIKIHRVKQYSSLVKCWLNKLSQFTLKRYFLTMLQSLELESHLLLFEDLYNHSSTNLVQFGIRSRSTKW